ncbi:MAG: long-chain fatty acid--CoA ligase, partial [Proteobacteria bacterium]|nr:long-chain fatty acid--CoA ligase [Pseudomonadota bacterium]
MMVPTLINIILNHPDIDTYDLSSLKKFYYGSSPMPRALLEKAIEKFGPIFTQFYGMAEASPATMLYPWEHKPQGTPREVKRLSSAGRPCLLSEMRIVDADGHEVEPGEVGEIIHRGDNVLTEYWRNPEATAEFIKDGWFYSGDMATVDEDGYVYFMDRKKDMIISGGYNIWPSEVEDALYRHESVLEA